MKDIRLSNTIGFKSENLQLTKFVASIMVILSHSFVLGTMDSSQEYFVSMTNGQLSMGGFAVAIFFLCSGYLISRSLENSKSTLQFFQTRIVRLIPALFFVCLMSLLLCGFISDLSAKEYYTSLNTWSYMLNAIFVKQPYLPGVFTRNIHPLTVNGSLWTLRLEVICYILCFIIYKLGFFHKKKFILTIPFVLIASNYLWNQIYILPNIREILLPALLFYIGVAFWVYREHIRLCLLGLVLSVVGLIFLFHYGYGYLAMLICFPYICMVLWFGIPQCSKKLGILGNYSYTIYLWAFPIQQAVVHFHGGYMNSHENFISSMIFTIPISILTYHFIEKRAFQIYKNHSQN